jgi:hypothetical protein
LQEVEREAPPLINSWQAVASVDCCVPVAALQVASEKPAQLAVD